MLTIYVFSSHVSKCYCQKWCKLYSLDYGNSHGSDEVAFGLIQIVGGEEGALIAEPVDDCLCRVGRLDQIAQIHCRGTSFRWKKKPVNQEL